MNDFIKPREDLENLANLVADMYDLMSFYRIFALGNSIDNTLDINKIQKIEEIVLERYPEFRDVKKVDEVYSTLCLTAKIFYQSKPAQKMNIPVPDLFKEHYYFKQ